MIQTSLHILMIDDNQHGLSARRAVLEAGGYRVETALGGAAGVEQFEKGRFDLVVTDYRMPGFNGPKVVKHIRAQDMEVPIVILSGFVRDLGLTPEEAGVNAVLTKGPTEGDDLLRTVARLTKPKPGRAKSSSAGADAPKKRSALA